MLLPLCWPAAGNREVAALAWLSFISLGVWSTANHIWFAALGTPIEMNLESRTCTATSKFSVAVRQGKNNVYDHLYCRSLSLSQMFLKEN